MNGMEQTISKSYSQSAEEIDKLRKEAEEEKRKLERKIAEAEEEYSHNFKMLESSHEEEKDKIFRQKDQEAEVGKKMFCCHMNSIIYQ